MRQPTRPHRAPPPAPPGRDLSPGRWLPAGLYGFGRREPAQPRPGRLELQLEYWPRRLGGLVCWPCGALLLSLSLEACTRGRPGMGPDVFWVALAVAVGLVQLAAGGWLLLDLGRVRLDRRSGLATAGLLPGLRRSRPLRAARYIHISCDQDPADPGQPRGLFRAVLVFGDGAPGRLPLTEEPDLAAVWDKATLVAAFLRVPVRGFLLDGGL